MHISQLTRNKKIPSIEWKIVRKVFCDAKINYCLLCFKEKYIFINYPHEGILLNKRSELISKCRHKDKNMLANIEIKNKWSNDSMDENCVLFVDILCFLFLLFRNKKIIKYLLCLKIVLAWNSELHRHKFVLIHTLLYNQLFLLSALWKWHFIYEVYEVYEVYKVYIYIYIYIYTYLWSICLRITALSRLNLE